MASTGRWVQCFLNNGTTGLLRSLTSEKQFNVSNVSPTIAISYALPSSPRIKVSPQMLSGPIILVQSTHRVNKTACTSIYKCFILPIPEYRWTLWDRNRTEQNKFHFKHSCIQVNTLRYEQNRTEQISFQTFLHTGEHFEIGTEQDRTNFISNLYIVYSSQHWHIHHITHILLKLHLPMSRTVDIKYLV